MLAVVACAVAIASVPVFSRQAGLSIIPQLLALAAVGMAGVTCFLLGRIPRIHLAVIAYLLLVAMWAFTVPDDPAYKAQYLSLVKLSVLTMAVHLVIRTPRHLLFLLGAYSLSGAVALVLNWSEIRDIRYVVESGSANADVTRFEGTFSNANAAGVFAAFAALSSLIVFYNTRHVIRWVILACGVTSGLVIGGLTGSRTGMLGLLIAGMSVPVLALAGKREDLLGKWLKGSLFLLVAAGIALATLTQLPQFERLTRLTEGADADESTYTRWGMAKECVRIWLDYPVAGAGFQGFQRASWFEGSYSHTTFGEVLANGGVIGFGLLGIFYAWPGLQLVLLVRGSPNPGVRRLALAFLVYCVIFSASSVVAVLHVSRDLVPLWAAICGWLLDFRKMRYLRGEKSERR
jgi:hypothetical protein